MARLIRGSDESDEPYLKRSLQDVEKQITERIEAGESLTSASNPMSSIDQLKDRREAMYTWDEYNRTMLKRLFGGGILDHYTQPIAFGGGSSSPQAQVTELDGDIRYYLRQLGSIKDRLPLWADDEPAPKIVAPVISRSADGPIFVVHGQDSGRKNEVARVLEKATDREVVVLHEQPSKGRTVLEKFEQHAQEAAFAVVILTADDEGQIKGGTNPKPRGGRTSSSNLASSLPLSVGSM